jgi:hypothetical protein
MCTARKPILSQGACVQASMAEYGGRMLFSGLLACQQQSARTVLPAPLEPTMSVRGR